MTYKEAIEINESEMAMTCAECINVANCDDCRKKEYYDTIRFVLRKEIPMKLIPSSGSYKRLRGNQYPIVCPTCKCGFTRDADYNLCPNCGQRLDWSTT